MVLGKKTISITRLEAFSDAVFAFAATLLVVSLDVPSSFPELVDDLKGFAAFAISFTALVMIWSVHNAFFKRFELNDRVTIFLNSCLLFVVLFYVFPLKFMAESISAMLFNALGKRIVLNSLDELAQLFMLYSAGFMAIFLLVALMYGHAWQLKDNLKLGKEETQDALYYMRNYLILSAVGFLSVVLSVFHVGLRIGLPGMIYFITGPACYLHGILNKKRK